MSTPSRRLMLLAGALLAATVVGATYWPEPDIAVKVDYVIQRSQSTVITARNAFNVGLGWWF